MGEDTNQKILLQMWDEIHHGKYMFEGSCGECKWYNDKFQTCSSPRMEHLNEYTGTIKMGEDWFCKDFKRKDND
jgi:hypothetical protein